MGSNSEATGTPVMNPQGSRWANLPVMYAGATGDAPVFMPKGAASSPQPQSGGGGGWWDKVSSGAKGAMGHISDNPDLYLRLFSTLAPRGYRAPLAALGGAAEIYKQEGRMDDYVKGRTGAPTLGTGGMPVEGPPTAQSGARPPRSKAEAALASVEMTDRMAREDRAAAEQEEARARAQRPAPPKPGAVTVSQGTPLVQRKPAQPSLEQLARLLVMRGRFGPPYGDESGGAPSGFGGGMGNGR